MFKKIKKALATTLALAMFVSVPFPTAYAEEIVDTSFMLDFEEASDLEGLHDNKGVEPTIAQGMGYNGGDALKIEPNTEAAKIGYDVGYEFEEIQVGKVVSAWIYDDGTTSPAPHIVMHLTGSSDATSEANRIYFGIRSNAYSAFSGTSTAYVNYDVVNNVSRSTGWHNIVVDMSVAGKVTYLIDGTEYAVQTLEEGELAEFKKISFINFWSAAPSNVYIDDISVTDSVPVVAKNGKVNDVENTFTWTPADGTVATDYEYSVDSGNTWMPATTNVIAVGDKNIAKGQIMVRYVEEGTTHPSIANAENFTTAAEIITEISQTKDFEIQADAGTAIDPLLGFGTTKGTFALSEAGDPVYDGLNSLKLTYDEKNVGMDIFFSYDEVQVGKKVSFMLYDDLDPARIMTLKLTGSTKTTSDAYIQYFGLKNTNGNPNVQYNAFTQTTNDEGKLSYTSFSPKYATRTEGWNEITIDMTIAGEVSYYVNDHKVGTLALEDGEYAEFKTVTFGNSWLEPSDPEKQSVYIDNFTVSEPAPTPSNLVVDDEANTLSFTAKDGIPDAFMYEYTLDGGQTWTTATSFVIYVGNKEIAVNDISIRNKVPEGETGRYPSVMATTGFTSTTNMNLDMEDSTDMLAFYNGGNGTDVDLRVSNEYSRSGVSSMQITPLTAQPDGVNPNFIKYPFDVQLSIDELIEGKVLSIWYYDQMVTGTVHFKGVAKAEDTDNSGKLPDGSSFVLGVDTNASMDKYSLRPYWGTSTVSTQERTEGWHLYQWDYATTPGMCAVYVDDTLVGTYEADGFNEFAFIDFWSQGQYIHYYDDLTITDSREDVVMVPDAPTNPVSDDANNTFAWDYVEGKTEASLYEYSIDGGKTFSDVTANPQPVPEQMIEPGELMVRLKATDTDVAGMVLRNEARFSDPATVAAANLISLLEFCASSNANDYTAESYAVFMDAVEIGQTALETEGDYQAAIDAISAAREALVFDMEAETVYTFADEVVPVDPIYGRVEWADDKNISYITDHSYKIYPVEVEGSDTQLAQLKYTFPKALEDKLISFFYMDSESNGDGEFEIIIGNSETGYGNVISSINPQGVGDRVYWFYDLVDGEKVNGKELDIRRRNDLHEFEINMTNGDGTQIYMDSILVFDNQNLETIDYLEFIVHKTGTELGTYISVDELSFLDANPVTSISYPSDTVTLGYYETYEMNVVNWIIEKEHDYATTDMFTYSVADTSVAQITNGGSIQPYNPGETTATITSSNGVTKTVNVIVKDFAVESVSLSDSPITHEANIVDGGTITMEPEEIMVLNALITPSNATNLTKTWDSSNEAVATVKDGQITTIAEGETVITVTTEDGSKTASVTIVVAKDNHEYGIEVFVATNGNDFTGDGSMENPYATIERARDEIRSYNDFIEMGAVVYLREGTYVISEGIEFKTMDSGTDADPIKYTAYNGEDVKLSGALSIKPSDLSLTTEANEIYANLQDYAKGEVYEVDLTNYLPEDMISPLAQGYGSRTADVGGWLYNDGYNVDIPYYSVSYDGSLQTLARWPNEDAAGLGGTSYSGYARINAVLDAGQVLRMWNDDQIGMAEYIPPEEWDPYDNMVFRVDALADRMETWNGIPLDGSDLSEYNIWFNGYTSVDYTIQTSPIKSLTTDGVLASEFACIYWARSNSYNRLFVYNLIQELDIPGEWYIDENTKKLYIYPPEGSDLSSNEELINISLLTETMFTLNETNNITISELTLSDMLGGAYVVNGGTNNVLSRSTVTNTSSRIGSVNDTADSWAMNNGIEYCTVVDVNGGFTITAGDFKTLTPGNNFINGCTFDNYQTMTTGFNSAVILHGVGNVASSNEIKNSPNNALMWQGNDHVIEFNDIHDVAESTTDTSAIYTGRNTLHRGTVIKNNYIHDIGANGRYSHNSAIYLDDVAGGIMMYDNVIENVYWGVFVNGGQDNTMINNTIANCQYGVVANDWSYAWLSRWYQHGYGLYYDSGSMEPVDIDWWSDDSPYAKYPHLQTIYEDERNDSIYNKVINTYYPDTNDLFNYMIREVQPNATNEIKDWYFEKNNTK